MDFLNSEFNPLYIVQTLQKHQLFVPMHATLQMHHKLPPAIRFGDFQTRESYSRMPCRERE